MMKRTCRETKRVVDEGRAYLQEQFAEMRIPFVPAVANFVMVNVGDGFVVFEKLLQRKIIVRPLKGYGLPDWVRISGGHNGGKQEVNRRTERSPYSTH